MSLNMDFIDYGIELDISQDSVKKENTEILWPSKKIG